MLYKIDNNYYIHIGRKYIEVNFQIKGNDVSLIPNNKKFIEDNGGLKTTEYVFNDEFKKKLIESRKSRLTEEHKEKETNRSRFGR